MARPKGTTKTGGRKKGTPNKTTSDLKKWVFNFVNNNLEQFEKDFKKLDSADQFTVIMRLLPFVLPKQTENKLSFDEELTKAVKESMEQINDMFE